MAESSNRLDHSKEYLGKLNSLMDDIGSEMEKQKSEFSVVLSHAKRNMEQLQKAQKMIFSKITKEGGQVREDMQKTNKRKEQLRNFFYRVQKTSTILAKISLEMKKMEDGLTNLIQTGNALHIKDPKGKFPSQIEELKRAYAAVVSKHEEVEKELSSLVALSKNPELV